MTRKISEREKQHIAMLRKHLAECTVLLKKDGSFPLEKPCRIAAFGNGVRHTVKGGTGSGEVRSRYFVTVEEGLLDAGFEITSDEWLDAYDCIRDRARTHFKEEIRAKAKREKINIIAASMGAVLKEPEYELELTGEGEAAIYVLSRISGEGNDRLPEPGDFMLTETEIRDILTLQDRFDRFMLVLNTGGPVDLSPVQSVSNILILSQLGVETGSALADILLGKTNPSGKLATTWSRLSDYADGEFGNEDDTVYSEGIFVGYRYCDAAGIRPLFPFGYGSGYTTFETKYVKTEISKRCVTVRVFVLNTGGYAGKETVQLYVSAPDGALIKEVRSLAGFQKTKELNPGEEQTVSIDFDLSEIASYDTKNEAYILEQGEYVLSISTDGINFRPVSVLTLDKTVTVRKVKNVLNAPEIREYLPPKREAADTKGLERFAVDTAAFEEETVRYGKTIKAPDTVRRLTDKQLAYLNIGAFDPKGAIAGIIGNSSVKVPGASGESASLLKEQGIPSYVMADGPAGLRLSRTYYTDKKGKHSMESAIPETMTEFLPAVIQKILNRKARIPKNAQIRHQYTTALPIGTAIAQSWNTDLARLCGDIVGSEMEEFHVQLWLAPGMNIHRNVLCGRNFEYLSEDPLITGSIAAALTFGVQMHAKCGVTIKHYAANNQETNRYANNSIVSERAMREIYLRGFERCIKQSRPKAVMSSYNLLNGIHTSEHEGLCKAVLRDEFGFDGILMTDWIVAQGILAKGKKYPAPNAARVARAGHSLFMPGSRKDLKQLLEGIKNRTVTRADLLQNAAHLVSVFEDRK